MIIDNLPSNNQFINRIILKLFFIVGNKNRKFISIMIIRDINSRKINKTNFPIRHIPNPGPHIFSVKISYDYIEPIFSFIQTQFHKFPTPRYEGIKPILKFRISRKSGGLVLLPVEKEISNNLENSNDIFLQNEQKSMSEKRTKSDKVLGGSI